MYFVSVSACVYICAPQICRSLQRSEKAPDPQELEFQMAVSYHVGTEN